ncbi:MAG: hypothetical protein Q4C49_13850 [Bacillota bacterium]|nr:hypothetical protein [Bacillota bacterium]
MNKEDILLKNYSILIKNPMKNAEAIKSIITQFCNDNPKLAFRCWIDLLQNNIEEIKRSVDGNEFQYGTFGYKFVQDLESDLLDNDGFKYAVEEFAKNKQLLEILYTKFPIYEFASVYYAISFLIRNHKLQEASTILTAIYKNKTFNSYSELWHKIIGRFKYSNLDNYSDGGIFSDSNYKQDGEIQEFCMSWAERIVDEEEQAGAITHIMRIF